jgi:hypothetical protein
MPVVKHPRTTMVIAAVVIAVCGGVLWYLHTTEHENPYPMKDYYGTEQQQHAAEDVVAGLNSRNPDNVELFRIDGQPESAAYATAITQNITAVLPPLGCRYTLVGTEDKGEQDPADVPWYHPGQARGFDMKLQQICPGQPPTPRTIRVIAIPSGMGGYWAEAALSNQGIGTG